ncbi:Cell division trigger factor [hydrothermal vent metagenome]|uniref:peptidylprolyl isomerase n=1 Tax=hydrothermal vent metagenome TaxID=652676 RepID=A0A1W1EKJ8_9ZZZZ
MNITTRKIDNANFEISTTIENSEIESVVKRLAKETSKQIKVDGFRKGKVPVAVVMKMHGERLKQDAESELVRDALTEAYKELDITQDKVIGEPTFKKFETTDNGLEIELEVSIKPTFDTDGYKDVKPDFTEEEVTEDEVDERINSLMDSRAKFVKLEDDRAVEDGDMTLIDFEGSVDGELFEGGASERFNLQIGSNQFIPGFEEQIIGMKSGDEKTITVTFPKDYQAESLAGKDADFKVKLHEIQVKEKVELTEDMAKELLNDKENGSIEIVREKVKEQIEQEKFSKLYNDELKPKILEALVAKFDFDLPNNIVEQELDAKVNQEAQSFDEERIKELQNDSDKLNEFRDSLRDDAIDSVKATFIVDALAKEEKIVVSDEEVSQTLYYEAMMSGQNPQEFIKHYQDNNLIPAVKMGMIEDKLFATILGK